MDFSIEDIDLELDHLLEPIKKQHQEFRSSPVQKISLDNPRVVLKPEYESNNQDLFQVTNYDNYNSPFDNYEQLNDKDTRLNKLMQEFENDDDNNDWELDDQGRTRIFKGRFKFNIDDNDELENQLDRYLNSNKENFSPTRGPVKNVNINKRLTNKITNRIDKSATKLKGSFRLQKPFRAIRQKGLCRPNHRVKASLRPVISYKANQPSIFLVDSSTGSLNDATQFGTELNASNCEGFPLPEDVNEVVQIPTNEDNENTKMAIIKTFNNKVFHDEGEKYQKVGFYSKTEYDNFLKTLPTTDDGVEVVNQVPALSMIPDLRKSNRKTVKFADADKLEW
ncbi:hypothetical protein CLIB1444_06S00430 [[Candida] jaroonii]|uniref:Uncharacterized protein n=1 Tax=[Candida] jaroonii TaxID=467808 RepID=A0ACA9Y947_9ASCO|nr:hypothetical protein CLIB1444_06S00430 [[Candida] jaroonii]